MTTAGPLSRFKVIDLTRVRAGPTCVRHFADWGADVIKVEMPEGLEVGEGMGGPRLGPDFWNLHRNKRNITLNLKDPEGVRILKRLVKDADVVVENYRPDVKHRLGVDYETLSAINPRLVYISISGFGQDGPYALRPGFDQVAQGMGGLMSITGLPGQGPVRAGVPIADLSSGNFAAIGGLIALLEREVSGKGQWVQTSLLQAQIAMLDFQAARWLVNKEVAPQAGNDHPTSIPTGVFPTKDGYINIAAAGDLIYKRLMEALDAPELVAHADFKTNSLRSKNRKALNAEIAKRSQMWTSKDLVDKLNEAGVPCGPIYKIDEMFTDPQVQHVGMAAPLKHPEKGDVAVVNAPVSLSRTPSKIDRPAAKRGEHTDEVLTKLGLSGAEIADLRERRIV